jgi:hypothetical protein
VLERIQRDVDSGLASGQVLGTPTLFIERVAHGGTGHGSEAFRTRARVRPKLVAIKVSGCHLVLVICGVG